MAMSMSSTSRRGAALVSSLILLIGTTTIVMTTFQNVLPEYTDEEEFIRLRRVDGIVFLTCFTFHALIELFFHPLHHDKAKALLFGIASILQGTAFFAVENNLFHGFNITAAVVWILASIAPIRNARRIPCNYDIPNFVYLIFHTTFFAIAITMMVAAIYEARSENESTLYGSSLQLLAFAMWMGLANISIFADCFMPFDEPVPSSPVELAQEPFEDVIHSTDTTTDDLEKGAE